MARRPTEKELQKAVRKLEAKFAAANKRVVVVAFDDLLAFVKSTTAPLYDQSGNGNHLWPMPPHY